MQETEQIKKTDKVSLIVAELETIQHTIVTRAKETSIKDVRVSVELSALPKVVDTTRIKAINSNYATSKATVTFYRSYINRFVRETKQLNHTEYNKIVAQVEEKGLYMAYNLWVSGTVQQNKTQLFI